MQVHLVSVQDVKTSPNRQRRSIDSDRLCELADSMGPRGKGLQHPIVIRTEADPTLVSGERRLCAAKSLASRNLPIRFQGELIPCGLIPTTTLGNLTELQYEEAELEENVFRTDLTWQEHAAAIAKLHALRVQQNPDQRPTDTAAEILGDNSPESSAFRLIRDSEELAAYLDDPEIARAPNKRQALKILSRRRNQELYRQLGQGTDVGASHHKLHLGDAFQLLPAMADEQFNCIITDPPYGIDASSFGDQAVLQHHYQDDEEYACQIIELLAQEGYRICRPQAHMYIFTAIQNFTMWLPLLEKAGWKPWPRPLVWSKGNYGLLPRPEHGPRNCYEAIIFCSKGDKRVTGVYWDIIMHTECAPVIPPRHPAEKPASLYANLLKRTCQPGDLVLDPFAGSGPIFPASNKLQLTATGINISKDDYNFAASRLEETLDD